MDNTHSFNRGLLSIYAGPGPGLARGRGRNVLPDAGSSGGRGNRKFWKQGPLSQCREVRKGFLEGIFT